MKIEAATVEEYIAKVPEDKKPAIIELRNVILKNIPEGFTETLNYGMIGYVIPHTIYPAGYHANPKLPLPFINIAMQKNFIALYHMGLYADPELLQWFKEEYAKLPLNKLDMGKSCIRFKNSEKIPFQLIGELVSKMSVQEWVDLYECTQR
ncbi:hypothetical protein APR41_02920 [Salegentibacter salinarum]|uniref:YdhG-like domain-containing protein n=1 Tax=Salegentibacter salinarum TaxID=447422 RepID=A0A2N0TXV7_9FLAO|nr:DUF1801 domain-containing protein [Salegentibacter salinarum]PKD19574.1 hypothetical protein APR41_02920 [Salegentibacter salinarum]SKB42018.1 protein of unknown function (DU1801) [Salegentibacter salinarum]